MFTVNVPVTDLRSEPSEPDFSLHIDRRQESQLLFGELVEVVHETADGWVKIHALEQSRYRSETDWTGYPGWVRKEHLVKGELRPNLVVTSLWSTLGSKEIPLGTYLEGVEEVGHHWMVRLPNGSVSPIAKKDVAKIPLKPTLAHIVESAQKLIGHRYTWGGRCPFRPNWNKSHTSVDCSGLINLAYRAEGLILPRDAHDQYLMSDPVKPTQLRAADLIFSSPADRPQRMTHVMLFIEGDTFIDANITDGKVVLCTAKERFGTPFAKMSQGIQVQETLLHFGRPQCLKV